ncbi:MAG: flippase-like domain-containing protein [Syntrophorhabdaceae bacterium]|nr:flippase-like domain-containing protein [Syntrophorhabdaceae bacterium]
MKKRRLITITGFIISIVLLYLSLRGIDYRQLAETIKRADITFAFLPVLYILFCVSTCSLRWMRVVGYNARFTDAFMALLIGLFINNILPARIGEVARGYALSKRIGVPFTYAVSTVFIDRVFDLLGLLLITFIFFPGQALPAFVSKALYVLVTVFVLCVIALFAISQENVALKITGYLHRHQRPFLNKLAKRVFEIHQNLRRIRTPGRLSLSIVLTLANWFSMVLALYFSLRTFGVSLPFVYVPFVAAILNMGLAVPSSPGYIGVYEFLLVSLLGIFGVPKFEAFAVAIFFHASWYVPYNVLGFIFILKEHLHIKDIQKMEEEQ